MKRRAITSRGRQDTCRAAFFVALLVFAGFTARAGVPRTWDGGGTDALASTPENWSDDTAPVVGGSVILNSSSHKAMTWDLDIELDTWTQVGYMGTVTVNTIYGTNGFTNLTISGDCVISNGVWTHVPNPNVTYETNRLCAAIGGNLIIGPDAAIDVTGKGYWAAKGPGTPVSGEGGGSYGGVGNEATSPGRTYGSIVSPTNLGSGGKGSVSWPGGGAVRMMVGGNARVDGAIRAESASVNNRTGSGGSIWLTSGSINGAGTISAKGGTTSYGNGGGGRIALVVTNAGADFASFTGTLAAPGGTGGAGAGTIYLETKADVPGKGELIVNNGGKVTVSPFWTTLNDSQALTCEFARITLTNAGVLAIGPDDVLVASNTVFHGCMTNGNDGIVLGNGTLLVQDAFSFSNIFIHLNSIGSPFSPATSLTIGTNAEFRVDVPYVYPGDVTIEAGGNLSHSANPIGNTEVYKLNMVIQGSMNVQEGGCVDVTAKGFRAAYGPGKPRSGEGGGSYGGLGGETANPGTCYGSIVAPTNLGSGGAGNGPQSGGGAILLTVGEELRVDGAILAEGPNVNNRPGSGGSIHISAGSLRGSGTISANGGGAYTAGGGGRVALVVTNAGEDYALFTGVVRAWGGAGTSLKDVGAGTVYLRTAGQGLYEGTLIVDNSNRNTRATQINSNVTDTIVGDVIVRNKAYLLLDTNQSLTVGGSWSNAADFAGYTDSQVIFAGASDSTSTLFGSTTFMGLTCTRPDKTLLFETGATNKVGALGRLTLRGDGADKLVLRPTAGAPWHLNVDGTAEQDVEYVDVQDSTAGDATVLAKNSTGEFQNNVNWTFMTVTPGETNTWTGTSNSLWGVAANWSLSRAPVETDVIVIPDGRPNYPVFDAARTVNELALQTGGRITLNGYDLTVTNDAAIAGVLVASASETIAFGGDVDFTGGSFTQALSTVSLAGGAAQAFDPADLPFNNIRVSKTAGSVSFTSGLSARELRCEAPSGTVGLAFQQAASFMMRDLVLLGSAATTNITLRSSSDGQAWTLIVMGHRSVRGVDVKDSNAGGGLPIPAATSKDSGNNSNWEFGGLPAVWLGTTVDFHTPGNWDPAVVPDASKRVVMESAKPMTITGTVTVLNFSVGGGAGMATATVNAALTVIENIEVLNNGSLLLNKDSVASNNLIVAAGGLLTHSANTTTEANKLILAVSGDVVVEVNGAIDVTGKGYAASAGPGKPVSGEGGGSYGGVGTEASIPGPCYGSIVSPTNLGSGGSGNTPWPGGGAVLLTVGGTVQMDGSILAESVSRNNRTGSGGSINITAGSLRGAGTISANGGTTTYGCGGGGRIALVVTNAGEDFSAFYGVATARGGAAGYYGSGGAGTIYRQTASEALGRGTVWVENNDYANTKNTTLPSFTNGVAGESDRAVFHVAKAARLRLTNDFTVGDIWLDTANAVLDLGSNTLTVKAREHALTPGTVANYGAIVWTGLPPGVLIIVK